VCDIHYPLCIVYCDVLGHATHAQIVVGCLDWVDMRGRVLDTIMAHQGMHNCPHFASHVGGIVWVVQYTMHNKRAPIHMHNTPYTTHNTQRTTHNTQFTTHHTQYIMHSTQHPIHHTNYSTRNEQRLIHNTHHNTICTTHTTQHSTHIMQYIVKYTSHKQ